MKLNAKEFPWVGAIASVLLCAVLIALNFRAWQNQKQFADKSKRAYLVSRMMLKLTAASEAEKSAVMAVTDKDSKVFAEQSRAATLELEKYRVELSDILKTGDKHEKNLLDQFSGAFTGLRQIDDEILNLAVKNTNLKAYDLAFGQAADTLKAMYAGLSKIAEKNAGTPRAEKVMQSAFSAQSAALHIQTMLAPHIAEENADKMVQMEVLMGGYEKQAQKELDSLVVIPELRDDPVLKKAVLDFNRFSKIKADIISLSRENTNILSLSVSLGRKRKVLLQCQDLLSALQQAILEESNAGLDTDPVLNPRSPE